MKKPLWVRAWSLRDQLACEINLSPAHSVLGSEGLGGQEAGNHDERLSQRAQKAKYLPKSCLRRGFLYQITLKTCCVSNILTRVPGLAGTPHETNVKPIGSGDLGYPVRWLQKVTTWIVTFEILGL